MFYLVTSVELSLFIRSLLGDGLKELSESIKWWILTACLTLKTDSYIDFSTDCYKHQKRCELYGMRLHIPSRKRNTKNTTPRECVSTHQQTRSTTILFSSGSFSRDHLQSLCLHFWTRRRQRVNSLQGFFTSKARYTIGIFLEWGICSCRKAWGFQLG